MCLVHADDLVEEAGDFAVNSVDILGQANAEVAASQRTECGDQLPAIDKIPLCLDVHAYVSVWLFLPPPRLHKFTAPQLRIPYLSKDSVYAS